jgi:DNA topoisomerase-1
MPLTARHLAKTDRFSDRVRKTASLLRDTAAAARKGALLHVSCDQPSIRRVRRGKAFLYFFPGGRRVTSESELRRIRSLTIPPAWRNVWICVKSNGHLQCTGYDSRGRKQYRYHPRFRQVRDEAKYDDILSFAASLPRLRQAIKRDIAAWSLTKHKVVATVLRIMDTTSIRVGNDRYAKENGSFGLTTLRDRHARISGSTVEFAFCGKGGRPYRASIRDRKLAMIVKRCRDIPGQRLFQYVDGGGHCHPVTSTDVNEYIREATGHPFSAKEFRTWSATVLATVELQGYPPYRTLSERRRALLRAIDEVAEHLGNTRAICRKCYIHPTVLDAFLSDRLSSTFAKCLSATRPRASLRREECAVLALFDALAPRSASIAA